MSNGKWLQGSLIGAVIAALGASLCCVVPFILLALGISSAWASALTSLGFIRPLGIGLTFIFLIVSFWKLYILPKRCETNRQCGKNARLQVSRTVFWIVVIVSFLLLAFPWYAFLFN